MYQLNIHIKPTDPEWISPGPLVDNDPDITPACGTVSPVIYIPPLIEFIFQMMSGKPPCLFCTRTPGHLGPHVAHDEHNNVVGIWDDQNVE